MSLREAYELIKDEEHWCAGTMWQDEFGDSTSSSGEAVRFCASGALARHHACESELVALGRAARVLFPTSRAATGELGSVVWVNDHLGHAAVVQVFEKAIVETEGSL